MALLAAACEIRELSAVFGSEAEVKVQEEEH